MPVRTQAELQARIGTLLADNQVGDISAMDVRALLTDINDTLFSGTVSGGVDENRVNELIGNYLSAALVGNTELGINVTFNSITRKINFDASAAGSPDGVVNAIALDLTGDTLTVTLGRTVGGSVSGHVDLPASMAGGATSFLGLTDTPAGFGAVGEILVVNAAQNALEFVARGGGPVTVHTRYALLTAGAGTPSAADFLASTITSTTEEITVPAYATPMYLHFADEHSQLTTIQQTSSAFNGRAGFQANPTPLSISGAQYYVYSSVAARNPVGQRTWRLVP